MLNIVYTYAFYIRIYGHHDLQIREVSPIRSSTMPRSLPWSGSVNAWVAGPLGRCNADDFHPPGLAEQIFLRWIYDGKFQRIAWFEGFFWVENSMSLLGCNMVRPIEVGYQADCIVAVDDDFFGRPQQVCGYANRASMIHIYAMTKWSLEVMVAWHVPDIWTDTDPAGPDDRCSYHCVYYVMLISYFHCTVFLDTIYACLYDSIFISKLCFIIWVDICFFTGFLIHVYNI